MTTIESTANWKVKIYPNDDPPPHFHVQTDGGESLVNIATLAERRRGADKQALQEALAWAIHNHTTLARVWSEQNCRSDL